METKTETLTMEQAIEQGYTHFVEEEGESIIKFSDMQNDRDFYKGASPKYFLVDNKNPIQYNISADTIKDLITDYVNGQEEMFDEDDKLGSIAQEHDYSKLANELNVKFSEVKFYEPLDIQVVF